MIVKQMANTDEFEVWPDSMQELTGYSLADLQAEPMPNVYLLLSRPTPRFASPAVGVAVVGVAVFCSVWLVIQSLGNFPMRDPFFLLGFIL